MRMDPICIYHHNCADGFTAAWAVREALGDIDFVGANHGDEPPDVTGRDVIMVDFAYKGPVIDDIRSRARSLLILDHHKTAQQDLDGLPRLEETWTWADWEFDVQEADEPPHLAYTGVIFDMERSGAGIAWDFFHDAPRPPLIDHVEDRDLWRFALEDTSTIQAAVFAREYTFADWDELMGTDLDDLRAEGAAIERKHYKDIRELINSAHRRMVIGGHDVPVLNAPYFFASDAGHLMAGGERFAACYWESPRGRHFSLRSIPGGEDVSAIAERYGGGGHASAAGFVMPIGWEGDE